MMLASIQMMLKQDELETLEWVNQSFKKRSVVPIMHYNSEIDVLISNKMRLRRWARLWHDSFEETNNRAAELNILMQKSWDLDMT